MQRFIFLVPFLILILIVSCKENSSSEPELGNSGINGAASFLDGSPAAWATIELQYLANNHFYYDTSQTDGSFEFLNLKNGSYILRFKSSSYEINSYEAEINLGSEDIITHDVVITYSILDENFAMQLDSSIFFLRFHPEAGKIGTNFSAVKELKGYYRRDILYSITLSCEVYIIPAGLNWANPGVEINPGYIRSNFEYVTEADEEYINGTHTIKFTDGQIPGILSKPVNGFAFVKKDNEDKELKIPCVDFNNNDFGLKIVYN